MFKISCFGDEISPDLHTQVEVMRKSHIGHVELRSVWDKNVLDLSKSELNEIKSVFDANGIRISSIGSPIGKVAIDDSFEAHFEKFKKAIDAAHKMETEYIRIFSFYIDKSNPEKHEEEVLKRLGKLLEQAKDENVVLLHENEADIFGERSSNCLRLFEALDSQYFRAVFDPSNFVAAGEDVLNESFRRLKPFIEYMHIKDSLHSSGEIVVAGSGDGCLKEILSELKETKDMFLSLEPHLAQAGKYRGFSGPGLFEEDYMALKQLLDEIKAQYS